jgi:hypothetical protein
MKVFPRRRDEMAIYMLVVDFQPGVVDTPMEEWKPEEMDAHLDYYRALHEELVASGELVSSEVLAPPGLAKIVSSDGSTTNVVDGPFQEFKEWAAGYQIVEVEFEERAIEVAAKISAVPGPDGVPIQQPIQVRQVMEKGPSDAAEMETFLQQVGD